jgi:uncharacterized protein
MFIIDRRLNPGGKSLGNRQRFIRRAKALVTRAVRDTSKSRSIRDMGEGGEVSIPLGGVHEPQFRRASHGGQKDYLLPGNKEFMEGDRLGRPVGSSGSGRDGAEEGGGEDEFRFVLSQDEFLSLFLDDLELPDLAKRHLAGTESPIWRKAGYSVSGSPANLALGRTMRNSLSRRLALRRPKGHEIAALEALCEELERSGAEPERLAELRAEIELKNRRRGRIPYIDPIDMRYRQFQPEPRPIARAVMFCLMDVSGSMTEHMKDLAKRFFALLYIFLKRRYRHVEVVFIRHTHHAEEVDEETFFNSPETGGTMVSTALTEMMRIMAERFPASEWNIYGAQASDGDNTSSDNERVAELMTHSIMPLCQYFAYLEVAEEDGPSLGFISSRQSDLWRTYEELGSMGGRFAIRRVRHRRDIFPVFRDLFRRQDQEAGAAGS